MSKSPEEIAAEILPCPHCSPDWPIVAHYKGCPSSYRPAVAQAIREAEQRGWDKAMEDYIRPYQAEMKALSEAYKKLDTAHTKAVMNFLTNLEKAEEEAEQRGFQRGIERLYLLSCPFCGESQADRIVTAQIGHLIKCGWNTREKAVREAEQRGADKGREKAEGIALKAFHEVEQTLGQALGYPWYKDDQKNFPGATEADGVCTGDHVVETIAAEAANRIKALTPIKDKLDEATERGRALEREELIIILKRRWQAAALVQEVIKLLRARGTEKP